MLYDFTSFYVDANITGIAAHVNAYAVMSLYDFGEYQPRFNGTAN